MVTISTYRNPDLHMHSSFSDGSDTPKQLLENVCRAGLDVFSLTDHDATEGCAVLQQYLRPDSPRFIPGVELSCKDKEGKYHVLGYAYNVQKESIRAAVDFTHNTRMEKQKNRFKYLEEAHGFVFPPEDKAELLSRKNPGKPHFAALMLKRGYTDSIDQGFEILAGYHGKEPSLSPEDAMDAILQADGIPVLAHGILGDGSKKLTPEEIESRVARLKASGLMGLECYYSKYTPEQKEIMLSLADKYNLFVTAGSDYHGSAKTVRLGDTNSPDPERMKRFYAAVAYLL